jgi:hypothetical protein
MKRNLDGTYQAGVIYQLGVYIEDEFLEFYVGETTNADIRLAAHRGCAKAGRELLVYDFIRQLSDLGVETEMLIVDSYGDEGPADLEDEWIMKSLLNGVKLQNQKKGSKAWMDNMIETSRRMKEAGYTSLRKFKIWDAEQVRITNDLRHEQRIADAVSSLSLADKIKLSTKHTDAQKYKQMQKEIIDQKTASILNEIKR